MFFDQSLTMFGFERNPKTKCFTFSEEAGHVYTCRRQPKVCMHVRQKLACHLISFVAVHIILKCAKPRKSNAFHHFKHIFILLSCLSEMGNK